MAGKAPSGQGSLYKETDPRRKTKWRYEKYVTLPNGSSQRVIVRGVTQAETLKKFERKAKALQLANPDAERMTVKQLLERWYAYKAATVKPGTLYEYRRILDTYVVPKLGAMPISRVRPLHVQEVVTAAANEGKQATANNIRRYLRQAFRQAQRWELLAHNPLANIEPVPRSTPKRGKWERGEITRFLEAARASHYYPLFYAALFTGMRQGELRGLEWGAVGEKHITVAQTASRHARERVGTPKTAAGHRDIPLSPELASLLSELPRRGVYVFTTRRGTMMQQRNIKRAFDTAIAKAGVPVIKFHDMRRIAATFWARKGFTPKQIMKLLGHSTPHVALSVYTQVLDEQMEQAFLSEADLLSGGENGGDAAAKGRGKMHSGAPSEDEEDSG